MRILLADDHKLLREGIAMIIASLIPDSHITQVDNWQHVHRHLAHHPTDLALLDLSMPQGVQWPQELGRIKTTWPNLAICVITASDASTDIEIAFDLGIRGYLHKTASSEEMQLAIRQVMTGGSYFPDRALLANDTIYPSINTEAHASKITLRQREILNLLSLGNSNKEIARQLNVSEGTIKQHLNKLFKLLNAKNRVHAIQAAKQQGLI